MESNKVFIVQPKGIGDCIYSQTAVRTYAKGREIVWGVDKVYLEGLKRAYKDITWILDTESNIDYNRRDFYHIGYTEVVPLRFSDSILGLGYSRCMASKHLIFGLDYRKWKDQSMYQRDERRENLLLDVLGIRDKEFTLVNNNFWTIGNGKRINQIEGIEGHVVEMRNIDGFSLFDWSLVMEKAKEIHSVNTATLYLFELLDLKCPIHLYPRIPSEKDFKNVEYIFSKPYILH